MRKVTGSLSKSQCTVVFLNQLRSKIGVIYGSPEVTSGEKFAPGSRFRGVRGINYRDSWREIL